MPCETTAATINHFCHERQAYQLANGVDALDLLIIDTLHTATVGADENSAQHMGKVLHSCRLAINKLGCAVLLVHHTNKSGLSERGSVALRCGSDFVIKIEKIPDNDTHAVMSCEKLKDGERWANQNFSLQPQLESVYVSWNDPSSPTQIKRAKASDKEKLKAEMKRYVGTRLTCKTLAEAIAKTENYTRTLLSEMENAKECQRELSDPGKKSSNRNPWVYWIDAIQEREGLNG